MVLLKLESSAPPAGGVRNATTGNLEEEFAAMRFAKLFCKLCVRGAKLDCMRSACSGIWVRPWHDKQRTPTAAPTLLGPLLLLPGPLAVVSWGSVCGCPAASSLLRSFLSALPFTWSWAHVESVSASASVGASDTAL